MNLAALQQLIYEAASYMDLGRTEKAIAKLHQAIDAALTVGSYPVVAESQCFLADIHLTLQDGATAQHFLTQAQETIDSHLKDRVEPDLWKHIADRVEELTRQSH